MVRTRFCFAMAAAAACSAAAPGGTIHVNGSCGHDGWTGGSHMCGGPDGPKATIQAAVDAADAGDVVLVADGTYSGAGNREIDLLGKAITVRSAGGPEACVIDAQRLGRGFRLTSGETTATVIEGFTITNGLAVTGGGIFFENDSGGTIRDCVLTANEAEVGGAVFHRYGDAPVGLVLTGCRLHGNFGSAGVGGMLAAPESLVMIDCRITDNVGAVAVGGLACGIGLGNAPVTIVGCSIIGNSGAFTSGGAAFQYCRPVLVNSVFSRNSAELVGGVYATYESPTSFVNCTFTQNGSAAIRTDGPPVSVANSIVWNNGVDIHGHTVTVSHSDVGSFDPLFVQPGLDDLRLALGSPCIDAGSNALLPTDAFDLDGDGDTAEPLPVDALGAPRVQGAAVDMGAYEGAFDAKPAAAGDNDVGQGEIVLLVPDGTAFDPLEHPAVIFTNASGPDGGAVTVTQWDVDLHPDAQGFGNLGLTVALQTTLPEGSFHAVLLLPIRAEDLAGADPTRVDVTRLDAATTNWALAVSANVTPSPRYAGSIGDRVVTAGPGSWGVTNQPGDWGVYWDASAGEGLAWAIVDRAAEFGLGAALCPADCRQAPDGEIGIGDLLALLARWGAGAGGGPCDADYDGAVGAPDLTALLSAWGRCAAPVRATPPGAAGASRLDETATDLDGSGRTDRADLEALVACWRAGESGPCGDLDGDGTVGARDLVNMLARWGLE